MPRKCWFWLIVGIFALVLIPAPQAAEKVTFVSSWVLSGPDVPYFAARDKGTFRKEGIDLKIVRGYGSGNTIKTVSARKAGFGFADMASLVGARARGAKAKSVSVVFGKAPHGVYFLEGSGIRKPKDLEGRSIGAIQGAASYRTFEAFANLAGLDRSKIKFQFMTAPSLLPSVMTGKVDAALFYITQHPGITIKARKINKAVATLLYRDSGFNIYSNSIIAHEDDIKSNPDRIRRLVRASIQGHADGADHPEEAVKSFIQHNPDVSKEVISGQWKVVVGLFSTPEAKKNGIGYMLREKVKFTRDLMTKLLKLKVKVKLDDLYTNRFNPKISPKSW
ncbi:MAG: ABC transporter substrate-binding protein [Nitrospinota bacterium]